MTPPISCARNFKKLEPLGRCFAPACKRRMGIAPDRLSDLMANDYPPFFRSLWQPSAFKPPPWLQAVAETESINGAIANSQPRMDCVPQNARSAPGALEGA